MWDRKPAPFISLSGKTPDLFVYAHPRFPGRADALSAEYLNLKTLRPFPSILLD